MDSYGFVSGISGYAVRSLTVICALALSGCGGGASGESSASPNLVASPNVVESPNAGSGPAQEPTPSLNVNDSIAQLEAFTPAVTPGWTEPTGTAMVDVSSLTRWSFVSQKVTSWTPGSVSVSTASVGASVVAFNFDFGCNSASITPRDADCRNVVAMYSRLNAPIAATSNGLVALTVRNADMRAEYSLRVKDSSGQTLQFPFQVRTIENQNSTQWSLVRIPLKYPSVYWGGANTGHISGNLVEMTIVAAPRNSDSATLGLNYPKGAFELKSAQFFANAGTTYQLKGNASVDTSGLLPSLEGRLVVAHNSFDASLLQKAKDAGFSAIRRDLLWEYAEVGGRYVFTSYSAGAENLNSVGMRVLWILDYGHPDHGGAVPVSQGDYDAFTRFAQAAVQFGKTQPVLAYEVWNEPNMAANWPNPDPVTYGSLLNSTISAIRVHDSVTPIVSGGVAIDEPSYLFKLAKTGALARVNAVGIHPYRKDSSVTTNPTFKRSVSTPEMYANDRLITKAYLANLGVNAPLWNTESGLSTVFFLDPVAYPDPLSTSSRNRQGQLILRSVLTQIALNEPLITVYRLMDKGVSATDKEMNFGLLDASGNEKPAYAALKNLNTLVKSKVFNGKHTDVPPGMHALRWTNTSTGAKTVCMWVDNSGEEISVTLPTGFKSVVNWKGEVIPVVSGQSVTLRELDGPLYVQL